MCVGVDLEVGEELQNKHWQYTYIYHPRGGHTHAQKKWLEHGYQQIHYISMEAITKDMAIEKYSVDQYLHESNRP